MGRSRKKRKLDAGASAEGELSGHVDVFGEAHVESRGARRRRLQERHKRNTSITAVDRSGSVRGLERAAKKLKTRPSSDRILRVPQWDMPAAVEAMRKAGVDGVVTNLCGSRRVRVSARR